MSTSARSRYAVVLAALVAVVALATTACATFRGPAWQVGDVSVSIDDFYQSYLDSLGTSSSSTTTTESKVPTADLATFMTNEIQKELLRQGLASKGIVITDAERSAAEQALAQSNGQSGGLANPTDEQIEIQASITAMSERLAQDAADLGYLDVEAEARKLYEANKDQLVTPGETCAHFILVPAGDITSTTPPTDAQYEEARVKADEVHARLATEDFATVSKEVSAIEEQLPGGDFGCQTIDNYPTEVQPIVEALQPGELSQPTKITGGYLITRLDSRTDDSEPPSFEEVHDDAVAAVLRQQGQRLLGDWLRDQARNAFVVVDPRFGSWDAENATVTPPAGAATPTVPTSAPLGLDQSGTGSLGTGGGATGGGSTSG